MRLAVAVAFTMALAACTANPPPPPLTETDLRHALTVDMIGKELPPKDVDRILADKSNYCIKLHGTERSFEHGATNIRGFDRVLMRFGLRGGLSDWRTPGFDGNKPVAAETEAALERASAKAILKIGRAYAKDELGQSWPSQCRRTYALGPPLYEGDIAFIAQSSTCGGLCGGGEVIALKYEDGRWRVVGVRATWQA